MEERMIMKDFIYREDVDRYVWSEDNKEGRNRG